MIAETTALLHDLTDLFNQLAAFSAALAAVVSPWIGTVLAAFAAWWARRSIKVTEVGNQNAELAAKAADAKREVLTAKVEEGNHLTTQAITAVQASTQTVVDHASTASSRSKLPCSRIILMDRYA